MNYLEIKIFTDHENIDEMCGTLYEMGFDSLVIEDGADVQELLDKKELYRWDYIDADVLSMKDIPPNVKLYIEDSEEGRIKAEEIKSAFEKQQCHETRQFRIEVAEVCDEDWKDKWKAYFKPTRITDRIVIKPTWEDYNPETLQGKVVQSENLEANPEGAGDIVIEIDPGMAFGTGIHPTTIMCIKLLEKYIKDKRGEVKNSGKSREAENQPQKINVIDAGCGSGILSIAAARLCADEVTAIDIDPIALEVTEKNTTLNQVQDKVKVRLGDLMKGLKVTGKEAQIEEVSVTADILVANLTAELIVAISGDIRNHLKDGGVFICSGILAEKQEKVCQTLQDNKLSVLKILAEDDWCAIAAKI